MSYEKQPIILKFNGKRIRLTARISFSGDYNAIKGDKTIKEIILEELALQFSSKNPYFTELYGNEYDFPDQIGERIKISAKWIETDIPPYVRFHVIDSLGISSAPGFPLWRKNGNKHLIVFTGDIRALPFKQMAAYLANKDDQYCGKGAYSPENIGRVAAHEFGHALGLGDLYGGWAPYGLCYRYAAAVTNEMPLHDIMRTHFCEQDFFTPNDLEMALLAQKENAPQTHLVTGKWLKGLRRVSAAVRLQNIDNPPTKRPKKKRERK